MKWKRQAATVTSGKGPEVIFFAMWPRKAVVIQSWLRRGCMTETTINAFNDVVHNEQRERNSQLQAHLTFPSDRIDTWSGLWLLGIHYLQSDAQMQFADFCPILLVGKFLCGFIVALRSNTNWFSTVVAWSSEKCFSLVLVWPFRCHLGWKIKSSVITIYRDFGASVEETRVEM